MNRHFLLSAAIVALGMTGQQAYAASCASRDALVSRLESMYSEKLTARGLQSADSLMEVFSSPESGTFTVLLTNPKGVSCIVGAGTDWLIQEPEAGVAGIAG